MVPTSTRSKWILLTVVVAVVTFTGIQMYYSLTPPRHADHDHAMASLDAGGFLRIETHTGKKRNLVGRPGHVLVLHFFDPAAGGTESLQAARFAAAMSADPDVEFLFIAWGRPWEEILSWADQAGVPRDNVYRDDKGATAHLLGVRRWPETLIYAADGKLAYQSMGPMDWSPGSASALLARAKAGVDEIH